MTQYVAKWPDDSGTIHFTETESNTWKTLYERQIKVVQNRACPEFIAGLEEINFASDKVPQMPDVNQSLQKTGWKMLPVQGTVQVDEFFTMLSQREFPVANFIRIPEELDYLKQPDLFHEFFGHGPLLMNEHYANFMQWYGEVALKLSPRARRKFSRLFWFTIEFGLTQTQAGLRIYGGGILSSYAETIFSLESDEPARKALDVSKVLETPYDYQNIQTAYFFLPESEGLAALFELQTHPAVLAFLETQDAASVEQPPFVIC